MKRRIIASLVAVAAVVASVFVVARPAFADTCPYPYVCFFNGSTITGKYKVVTYPNFQNITGTSMYSTMVQNTRRDDVVHIRFRYAADGSSGYICMPPAPEPGSVGDWEYAMSIGNRITGVAISSSDHC